VKVLHILKSAPDATTKRIIELQSAENQATVIDLTWGNVDYDKLIADLFSHDKTICW